MAGTFWPEHQCVQVVLLHPCRKWVVIVIGCGGMSWCALRCSRGCCIVCGVPVVKLSWVLEHQDGAVVGLSWPLPSGLALSSIHTSCFSCHTPASNIIKGTLLETSGNLSCGLRGQLCSSTHVPLLSTCESNITVLKPFPNVLVAILPHYV